MVGSIETFNKCTEDMKKFFETVMQEFAWSSEMIEVVLGRGLAMSLQLKEVGYEKEMIQSALYRLAKTGHVHLYVIENSGLSGDTVAFARTTKGVEGVNGVRLKVEDDHFVFLPVLQSDERVYKLHQVLVSFAREFFRSRINMRFTIDDIAEVFNLDQTEAKDALVILEYEGLSYHRSEEGVLSYYFS